MKIRHRWALAGLILDLAAIATFAVTIGGISPSGDHDDHFATALLVGAAFQSLAVTLIVLSSLALAAVVIGIVRQRERGALPAGSLVVSALLLACGIVTAVRWS